MTIASKGEIFVGMDRVPDAELERVLRARAAGHKDAALVIHADRTVPYARVVRVIDSAKKAGLSRIAISTPPGP